MNTRSLRNRLSQLPLHGVEMSSLLWRVQPVVIALIILFGFHDTVIAKTDSPERACPTRPFEEVRADYRAPDVPRGEELIDRAVFWSKMKEIVAAKEVFKFTNRKGKVKDVFFHRSVLDSEHQAAIEAILRHWEDTTPSHPKHLALLLGTAYRETCGIVSSGVGEACGCKKTCKKTELVKSSYGLKDSCGRAYFGRGFVQITKPYNYDTAEQNLGIPISDYPDFAYDQSIALRLLMQGAQGRWYGGKRLNDYLNDSRSNWVEARAAINPGSPNKVATGYLSCRFYDAVQAAYKKPAPRQDPALCMKLKNA